jgi:hypothetical protein
MDDRPVPLLLYHYTTAEGLLGIVQSRSLWATHIRYLNDAEEVDYATNLGRRVLQGQAQAAMNPREREILERLGGSLFPNFMARMPRSVCVASFSVVGDGLGQWRGYCPGGAGYSLGFVTQSLVGEAVRQGFRLDRCLYDEVSQRGAIIQALEELRRSVQWTQALEQGTRFAYMQLLRAWWDTFEPVAPTIKHRAFHEEQEWRLISAPRRCGWPHAPYGVGCQGGQYLAGPPP